MGALVDLKKREQAYILYQRSRNLTMVAQEMGVDKSTIVRWKKEENWDSKLLALGRVLRDRMDVNEKAKSDIILQDMRTELNLLDLLDTQIAEAIYVRGLRPEKWADVLATLKYSTERKDKIFGKAKEIQKEMEAEAKGEIKPTEEEKPPLTEEQKIKADVIKSILNDSSKIVDLNQTEYTPIATEEN